MSKELCFRIENKNLFLEQVLVDYMEVPIFFLCKDNAQYYISLCTDIHELSYVVAKVSISDVHNLLHEKLTMRDIILNQAEYWKIISGEEVSLDCVTKHLIQDIDMSVLPEEGACFKILTEEIDIYVKKFEEEFSREYYKSEYFEEIKKMVSLDESAVNNVFDTLEIKVEKLTEIGAYSVKLQWRHPMVSPKIIFGENMTCIKETVAVLSQNSVEAETWKTDDSFIAVAA